MMAAEQITNYATLKDTIARWLNRESDQELEDEVPQFVQLAEARINNDLGGMRLIDMERTSDIALNDGDTAVPLPQQWIAMRDIKLFNGTPPSGSFVRTLYDVSSGNEALFYNALDGPRVFKIIGGQIEFLPQAASGTYFTQRYWRSFQRLGNPVEPDDKTIYAMDPPEGNAFNGIYTRNALLDKSPDLYLYASLIHAEGYLRDDTVIAKWEQMVVMIVEQLRRKNMFARSSGLPQAPIIPGGTP